MMLTAESCGSVLANVIRLAEGATAWKSGGGAERPQLSSIASRTSENLRKGRQYSVKTFGSLAAALLVTCIACREQTVDVGALITARTVGVEHLQRGQLADAERDFREVIALAPRDPLGYANLGLTYLRGGRYKDAESQLQRARRLEPANPEVALILAKLYAVTGRADEARKVLTSVAPVARVLYALAELERPRGDSSYAARLRAVLERAPANLAVRLSLTDALLRLGAGDSALRHLEDVRQQRPEPPREARAFLDTTIAALRAGEVAAARMAFDRLSHVMALTTPYQASLARVNWVEGPLPGRPVLAFNPASLITMRGVAPASNVEAQFTDVTGESGLPDSGGPVTALALGDYDGDGEDNLLVARANSGVHIYTVHGGFVADITDKAGLPLPAGVLAATFADYDNDGWLDLFAIGTDHKGHLLHNRAGKRFEDVTESAGRCAGKRGRRAVFFGGAHRGGPSPRLVRARAPPAGRHHLEWASDP